MLLTSAAGGIALDKKGVSGKYFSFITFSAVIYWDLSVIYNL